MSRPNVPPSNLPPLRADLVLEGGGVRGIGLVGAVEEVARAGYSFPRVAGTSAGAVVAAVVASLGQAGEPPERITELAGQLDYRRVADATRLGRVPLVGGALSVLVDEGLHDGGWLERWLEGLLAELGVRTFGDLRTGEEPLRYAYRLVVTASDLSRRRLVRLPWDLPDYGVDPDTFPVARAVRASAAIPFFFRPVRVAGATWVDGGLLSDFPVGLFDRGDTEQPRWPTFGVRLRAAPGRPPVTRPVRGVAGLGLASVESLLNDRDAAYVDEECTRVRTVFVPAEGVSLVDFRISPSRRAALVEAGRAAARRFLAEWDLATYVRRCRTPPSAQA